MQHSMYDNIVCAKFDRSLDHPITMYDNLPYKRDSDYCNAEKLTLQSGKIIKYYLCINHMEGVPINNRDDEIESILASIQAQERKRIQVAREKPQIPDTQDGITPEQIQSLLKDPDEETEDAVLEETEDAGEFHDPFAGVEDW